MGVGAICNKIKALSSYLQLQTLIIVIKGPY